VVAHVAEGVFVQALDRGSVHCACALHPFVIVPPVSCDVAAVNDGLRDVLAAPPGVEGDVGMETNVTVRHVEGDAVSVCTQKWISDGKQKKKHALKQRHSLSRRLPILFRDE
jgi:hypothetical protein